MAGTSSISGAVTVLGGSADTAANHDDADGGAAPNFAVTFTEDSGTTVNVSDTDVTLTDTDDTGEAVRAWYGDLEFLAADVGDRSDQAR